MIKIHRDQEPEMLRDQRYYRLARAEIACANNTSIVFEGYDCAREALHAAQNCKCAYCEMQAHNVALPVEHFRPKDHAIRADGSQDRLRYWWLAWTWENLFFSCTTCNSKANKGNRFPLSCDADALTTGAAPPGSEDALLIDPSWLDPIEHIQFKEVETGKWSPVARSGSRHGDETIKAFGLDHPTFVDFYCDHVTTRVAPAIEDIRTALREEDAAHVQRVWRNKTVPLFAPKQPYHALVYDVLDQAFPADVRAARNLELVRPGDFRLSIRSSDKENPAHAGLPPELSRQSRALGPQAETRDDARNLLIALCQHQAFSLEELAAITERAEGTVRTYLTALITSNMLVCVGQRYDIAARRTT
jgi:uncharacterized protein (TIGR02646 family)